MPAKVGPGESSIRQFAIDFLERKRPELLAILADIDLHSQASEGNHAEDQVRFGS